jgi:hypothetical protein
MVEKQPLVRILDEDTKDEDQRSEKKKEESNEKGEEKIINRDSCIILGF